MESIAIRVAKFDDLDEINRLVERVFHQFVAPKYSEEGVEEFKRYIDLDVIRARFDNNHLIYLAEDLDSKHIVGMLEIRNYEHISLFFVDKAYMGQNIGRKLSELAFERCVNNGGKILTVNSSPNAIGIYEKLGFKATDEEQVVKGIKFVPMEIEL